MSTYEEQYRAFARYNRWMNEKLYAVATELCDEERNSHARPGALRGLAHALPRARVTDIEIDRWAASVTEEKLASKLAYVSKGATFEWPMWWCAAQMFNHQTHHRGQVTTLLMQTGHDPGATDLFAMLRSAAS